MAVERIIPDELAPHDRALTEHVERYELAASLLLPDDTIVDAACGVGYGSSILAKKCSHVYAYDNSQEAISYAAKRYKCDNIACEFLDIDRDVLPECDVLVSFETIEHLMHPTIFLEKAKGKARRLIVLSTPIIPTKDRNPFHLHDFDRELVEEMMLPWQPAYFCMQSGVGEAVYGVWVFSKGEGMVTAAADRLVGLNLRHQQIQFMYHDNVLQRLKGWVAELEQGKVWLEEQWAYWRRLAEAREQRRQEQQARIEALEQSKAQIKQRYHAWQHTAQEQGSYLENLQARAWFRLGVRLRLLPRMRAAVDEAGRQC